jgi:CYTH domain-containing protein
MISSPKGVVGDARHSHDFFDGSVFGLDVYEGGINGCVVGDVALDAVYTFRDGRDTVRCAFPTCSVQLLAHMV